MFVYFARYLAVLLRPRDYIRAAIDPAGSVDVFKVVASTPARLPLNRSSGLPSCVGYWISFKVRLRM